MQTLKKLKKQFCVYVNFWVARYIYDVDGNNKNYDCHNVRQIMTYLNIWFFYPYLLFMHMIDTGNL